MERTITRTFEDFRNYVTEHILDYLPEEYQDATIKAETVNKPSGNYTGLTARLPNDPIAAAANLELFYEKLENGTPLDDIMERIAEVLQTRPSGSLGGFTDWIKDYNQAKTRLFIRVVNAELKADFLENVPHRIVADDLAITYHLIVNKDQNGIASAPIDNNILDLWNVSEKELYQDAMETAPDILPVKVKTLWGTVAELGMTLEDDMEAPDNDPLVVTNVENVNGAAALFYPGIAERIAERMGGTYCVLPSSVHEVLIVPDDGNYEALSAMVKDINGSVVDPKEVLSNHIYRYDETGIVKA